MNKFEYKNLTPFKWFVLENFPFIEADFDALTEWQLFCKLGKEMNKIINSENTLGTQVENVTNAFIELQNYVNNYFANLDVQEEINNKLNEMAESGELQNLLLQFLNSLFIYNNVAEMLASNTLVNNSIVKTLGFYTPNDNGGSIYKITNIEQIVDNKTIFALNNNLYAVLQIEDSMYAEQFGAKAELNFDNKEIIQTAVNNASKIKFGNGNFFVSNVISLNSNNSLKGNKTKIYTDVPYIFNGTNLENILIENLELESTVDTTNTKNMSETEIDERGYTTLSSIINITNSKNITINNCIIHGSFTGIYITQSNNVIIKNNECFESSSKIVCLSQSKFKLLNNYIHDIKSNELDYYPCYLFQATDDTTFTAQESSIINNNRFENNEIWDAIMAHKYNKIIISNNTFKNVRNGIDMSVVSNDVDNGNIIIDSNYIEGTNNDRWFTNNALNNAIFIYGDSKTNTIIISNNILKNFGKYNSPSGGSVLHLQELKNVVVTSNIIEFLTTNNTVNSAIITRGNIEKLIINDNIINSNNLKSIYLYHLICNLLTIKNNVLNSTINTGVIEEDGNSIITNAIIENSFSSNNQMYIRTNAQLNNITYTEENSKPIFSKTNRFIANIESFTIPANSKVQKFINKTAINYNGIFNIQSIINVLPAIASFPNDCIIRYKYSDSSNIQLMFYNLSNEEITIPTANYVLKIEE